jgi:hypothetical protein
MLAADLLLLFLLQHNLRCAHELFLRSDTAVFCADRSAAAYRFVLLWAVDACWFL